MNYYMEKMEKVERKAQNLSFTISEALRPKPKFRSKIRKEKVFSAERIIKDNQDKSFSNHRRRPNSSYQHALRIHQDSEVQEIK